MKKRSGAREMFAQMCDEMPINVMMTDPKTFEITHINKTRVETLMSLNHLLPAPAVGLLRQVESLEGEIQAVLRNRGTG